MFSARFLNIIAESISGGFSFYRLIWTRMPDYRLALKFSISFVLLFTICLDEINSSLDLI